MNTDSSFPVSLAKHYFSALDHGNVRTRITDETLLSLESLKRSFRIVPGIFEAAIVVKGVVFFLLSSVLVMRLSKILQGNRDACLMAISYLERLEVCECQNRTERTELLRLLYSMDPCRVATDSDELMDMVMKLER
jgi:hypothetical protein